MLNLNCYIKNMLNTTGLAVGEDVLIADGMKKSTTAIDKKRKFKKLLLGELTFNADKKNQISRHYWHAFPAKFPPDLPKCFIESLTKPNDAVLDPMAGSCTTLIEAASLNRKVYGFDIDNLSLMIGKAKLQNIQIEEVKKEGQKVIENAKTSFENGKKLLITELASRFDEETIKFLDFWFLPVTQLELLSILLEIEKVKDKNTRDFLKLIFSGIIITKSGGVTLALDLAHTRPHKVLTKKPNSAFIEFTKKLNKHLNNGYSDLSSTATLKEGNAKKLPLQDSCIDLIITSPPYANNAIDYMRAHKFSLVWFGYKISELKKARKEYIGSETVNSSNLLTLPKYVEDIVVKLTEVNKSKGKALQQYYSEMSAVMLEMFRVLKHNSACGIVVASSVLSGIDVQTHICLGEIGKQIGFDLVHIGERTIHRDSRMMPTSFKRNNSQIEARMHDEFVIGLWKP
jgi:DNA modification methylase